MNAIIQTLKHEIKAQEQLLQRYVELLDCAKISQQYHFIAGLKLALNLAEQKQAELSK